MKWLNGVVYRLLEFKVYELLPDTVSQHLNEWFPSLLSVFVDTSPVTWTQREIQSTVLQKSVEFAAFTQVQLTTHILVKSSQSTIARCPVTNVRSLMATMPSTSTIQTETKLYVPLRMFLDRSKVSKLKLFFPISPFMSVAVLLTIP